MKDVGLAKGDRNVAVGVRRSVTFQPDGGAVELQAMFGRKHLAGNPARGQGKEIVVPVLNALDFGQILARVL